MNILEIGGLAVIGLACGALVAAGMFTFITMLGIVTRLAQITKTARYILHYESWICAGAVLGNLLWLAVTMMEDFENWGMIQPVWTVCSFCVRRSGRRVYGMSDRSYCRNFKCISDHVPKNPL